MVEATPATEPAQAQPAPQMAAASSADAPAEQQPQPTGPQTEITMCACNDETILQTYCRICDQALCNDCYFDYHGRCGRGMTLKQASNLQINQFQDLLDNTNSAFETCSTMKTTVMEQEGIEEEVVKKVQKQYDQLKAIVDEQREEAFLTIKHLESIQEYTPPPEDFTQETLANIEAFISDL